MLKKMSKYVKKMIKNKYGNWARIKKL
jgi:hypothetical protein